MKTIRFRLLSCPSPQHDLVYLDGLPSGDPPDLCPLCLAEGDHNNLQEVGALTLPFEAVPVEEEEPEEPTVLVPPYECKYAWLEDEDA